MLGITNQYMLKPGVQYDENQLSGVHYFKSSHK